MGKVGSGFEMRMANQRTGNARLTIGDSRISDGWFGHGWCLMSRIGEGIKGWGFPWAFVRVYSLLLLFVPERGYSYQSEGVNGVYWRRRCSTLPPARPFITVDDSAGHWCPLSYRCRRFNRQPFFHLQSWDRLYKQINGIATVPLSRNYMPKQRRPMRFTGNVLFVPAD